MTPPPMTRSVSGTLGRERAPVELIMIFSSKGRPGNALASLPVAIMNFLASISCFDPSLAVTSLD
jgi:hypothetical protein